MGEKKSTCEGCKFAEWQRTANGRLHPNGSGKCTWSVTVPLAASAHTGGFGRDFNVIDGALTVIGRNIWRDRAGYQFCPVREREP